MRTCADQGCNRADIAGRGLCSLHYQRYRYRGQLDEVAPESERVCDHCGERFRSRRWGAKYCSPRCNWTADYQRNRPPRRVESCEECGGSLEHRNYKARFCSDKCSNDWRNRQRSIEMHEVKVATRRPCKGCEGDIPPERRSTAEYCSKECRVRSRRHETYGLTNGELRMLLDQNERCAICRSPDWGRKGPQVDHCHDTGRVRGVLCVNCNNGLGRFRDDPSVLRAAAAYLEGA